MPGLGSASGLNMLGLILYVPFVFVFVLTAIFFLRAGYKKGLWASLKSLVATIVATIVSVVLATFISKPITSVIVSMIESYVDGVTSVENQVIMMVLQGALSVAIALALFSIFLFIFSIIAKKLATKVNHEVFEKPVKNDKWAGFGIRLVDTFIFTFLFVLPIYGTLSNYVPMIKVLANQEPMLMEYVEVLESHPLTIVYDVAPTNLVYAPLSTAQIGDAKLDVVETMSTANEVYGYIERIKNASSDEEIQGIVTELINYVDEDVIQQRWLYEFAVSSAKELKSYMYKYPLDTVEKAFVDEFFEIADITYDEYKTNAVAAMNFLKFLLNNNYIDNRDIDLHEDQASLYEFGKLVNSTEQAIRCKNLLIKVLVLDVVGKDNYDRVNTLLSKALSLTPTSEDKYTSEANILIYLIESNSFKEIGEALAMFDNISQSDVQDWIDRKDDYDSMVNGFDQYISDDGISSGEVNSFCILNEDGSMRCYSGGGSVSFDGSGFSSGSFNSGSISSDGGNFSFSFSN